MARNSAVVPAVRSLGLESLLDELRTDEKLAPQLVYETYLPGNAASWGDLELPEPLERALSRGGVDRLWSHQAEGIAAVRRRENVLITTPTASGKSLVF